ncbi:MAG: enoyl-CoA hydratase/isomerase family protein, partial [Desertimonas sp.]
ALANQIASMAPRSIEWIKQLLKSGRTATPLTHRLQTMRVLEACFRSEDHHEGVRSFLERRDPFFVGR